MELKSEELTTEYLNKRIVKEVVSRKRVTFYVFKHTFTLDVVSGKGMVLRRNMSISGLIHSEIKEYSSSTILRLFAQRCPRLLRNAILASSNYALVGKGDDWLLTFYNNKSEFVSSVDVSEDIAKWILNNQYNKPFSKIKKTEDYTFLSYVS